MDGSRDDGAAQRTVAQLAAERRTSGADRRDAASMRSRRRVLSVALLVGVLGGVACSTRDNSLSSALPLWLPVEVNRN